MKPLFALCTLFVLVACGPQYQPQDEVHLSGYWDIEYADKPGGEHIDYKANNSFDYWQVKKGQGFRQKMMPHWSGTPESNGLRETLRIVQTEGDWFVHYQTPYQRWKERLIQCNDSVLELENEAGIRFHYKRYQPAKPHHHG